MDTALIFQSNMVLQHGKRVPVWGTAAPGEAVWVQIQGQEISTRTEADGRWQAWLEPLSVSEQETMIVKCGSGVRVYENVAVGEVWLAGGQSNMEFHMRYDKDYDETVKQCRNRHIRFFDYPEVSYEGEEKELDYSLFGFWRDCDADNLQYFSAVGYYFAENVEKSLDIPVGIIGCNWGGTRAVCWMDEHYAEQYAAPWVEEYQQGLKAIGDLDAYVQGYKADAMNDRSRPFDNPYLDRLMYGVSLEELKKTLADVFGNNEGAVPLIGPVHEWRPCGLFHTMLKQVIPYGIRGFLYYQGESDAPHADIYLEVMEGLISCWREYWKEELPFILTQLAPYSAVLDKDAKAYPQIRRCQMEIARKMRKVYCASIGDVGSYHDIHSKEKQPVGRRMALLARKYVYGEELLADAPVAESCVVNGNRIEIKFAAGDGLYRKNSLPVPMKLKKTDGSEVSTQDYELSMEGDLLIIKVHQQAASDMKKIEFAEEPYYVVNIYNRNDIPICPFTMRLE